MRNYTAGEAALRPDIRSELDRGGIIDLTTIGRRSGEPRRIEIVMHNIDGRLVISGRPRPETRAWLRNIEADPNVTIHLKRGVVADLAASARVVIDPAERRELLTAVARNWGRTDLDTMVECSPLIEVLVPGYPG
jgi:deazaflavin-dependent oxidoreductase (nitroreductase family)